MKSLVLAVLVAISGLAVGCKEERANESSKFTHIVKFPAQYYTGGPQQARPPDGVFDSGTRVQLVEDAGSYWLVEAEDGTTAYVSTGSLESID